MAPGGFSARGTRLRYWRSCQVAATACGERWLRCLRTAQAAGQTRLRRPNARVPVARCRGTAPPAHREAVAAAQGRTNAPALLRCCSTTTRRCCFCAACSRRPHAPVHKRLCLRLCCTAWGRHVQQLAQEQDLSTQGQREAALCVQAPCRLLGARSALLRLRQGTLRVRRCVQASRMRRRLSLQPTLLPVHRWQLHPPLLFRPHWCPSLSLLPMLLPERWRWSGIRRGPLPACRSLPHTVRSHCRLLLPHTHTHLRQSRRRQ